MIRKRFWAVVLVSLFSLLGTACYADTPAGYNSESDPNSDTCSGLSKVDIDMVSYEVEMAGILYDMTAYLLTQGCDPVTLTKPNLKITSMVTDDLGRRLNPVYDSVDKQSPWKDLARIPNWPGRFHIQLIAEANVSREDVANGNVEWVACFLGGRADKAPTSLDIDDLTNGHGVAECNVGQ